VLLILLCLGASRPHSLLMRRSGVPSRTISDEDFLRGDDTAGTSVTLTGHLSGGQGERSLPVLILLHGTDGPKSGAATELDAKKAQALARWTALRAAGNSTQATVVVLGFRDIAGKLWEPGTKSQHQTQCGAGTC
jgi:hypothetical protein